MNKLLLFTLCVFAFCSFNANAQCTATITYTGNDTFCIGGNVVLEANAGTAYQWQLNGGNISGETNSTYTATSGGNYTVIVDTVACSDTSAPQLVVVDTAIPDYPGLIAGNTAICVNTSQTYSFAPVAGAHSYTWTANSLYWPDFNTTTDQTSITGLCGQVMNGPPWTITLAIKSNNACGSSVAAMLTVTVAYPYAASGFTPAQDQDISDVGFPVCFLGHSQLMAHLHNVGGNVGTPSYQWYYDNTIIPGAGGQYLSIDHAGPYSVDIISQGLCHTMQNKTVKTEIPLPSITPHDNIKICQGSHIILNCALNTEGYDPNYNYVIYWLRNGQYLFGQTGVHSLVPDSPGTYKVIIHCTDQNCHCETEDEVLVNFSNDVAAPLSVTQNGNLLSATPGFASYQWYKDNVPLPGATNSDYTVTGNAYYWVYAIDGGGCASMAGPNLSTTTPSKGKEAISLYPNPGNGNFTLAGNINTNSSKAQIIITDISGRLIQKKELSTQNGRLNESVQIRDAPAGVYIIKLLTDTETKVLSYTKN